MPRQFAKSGTIAKHLVGPAVDKNIAKIDSRRRPEHGLRIVTDPPCGLFNRIAQRLAGIIAPHNPIKIIAALRDKPGFFGKSLLVLIADERSVKPGEPKIELR